MRKTVITIAAAGFLAFLPCIAMADEKEDQENRLQQQKLEQETNVRRQTELVRKAQEEKAQEDNQAQRENDKRKLAAQAEAATLLHELQAKVRSQTGLVDVTPEAVRHLISTLQEQREQLELDAAGAEGRQHGLQDAVARLSRQLDGKVAEDEVSKALWAVVSTRQEQLDRFKALFKTGSVPMSEVGQAEANLAQAKAEVAAARQKALSSASAEALDGWNRQLLEVTIAAQEREGRLRYIEKRLAALSEALGDLDQIEKMRAAAILETNNSR